MATGHNACITSLSLCAGQSDITFETSDKVFDFCVVEKELRGEGSGGVA